MSQQYSSHARKQFFRGAIVAAVLSAAVILALTPTRAVGWLENGAYDARVRWSARPADADKSIVVIDLDNPTFDILKDKLGRWPWSRRVWTELIRYTSKGQPRAIVFDAVYSGTENEQVDQQFADMIRNSGKVVLGFDINADTHVTGGDNAATQVLTREAMRMPPDMRVASDLAVNVPLPTLANAAAGLGCLSATLDPDGTIRRVPLICVRGDTGYPSLALKTAQVWTGAARSTVAPNARVSVWQGAVVTDARARILLRWHGGDFGTYQRIPLWNVICSMYPAQCDPSVKRFPAEYFKDKIVLIGVSAATIHDVHPTPFAESSPGFLAHATLIDNLLHGESMRAAPPWLGVLLVLVMAAFGALVQMRGKSPMREAAALLGIALLFGALNYMAFARGSYWVPAVAPLGSLALSFVSVGAVRFATTGRELRRTRGTLERYMSPAVVGYVMEHLDALAIQKRELTIFFSDIRNFTTMTESTAPDELIALLNEYLSAMTEIIFKYDGVVDKFIGDGILAYWGFTPTANHAESAARAALEMIERVGELNTKWKAAGRNAIAIGIGLNTGEVISGEVGAGRKVEFTVIGDPVNLASRLEGLNKDFKTSIIISEFTLAKLGDRARVRALGGVKVKGKTIETAVYELQGIAAPGAASAAAAVRQS